MFNKQILLYDLMMYIMQYTVTDLLSPMDDFSVSVTGSIDILVRISLYFNSSKFSVILHKLSALGVSSHNFCPRVGK